MMTPDEIEEAMTDAAEKIVDVLRNMPQEIKPMTADTLSLSLFTLMGGGHLLVQAGAELIASLVMFAATMDEGTDAGEPVHPAMIMLRLNTLSAAFLDIEINTADDDTPEEEPTNSTLQ